LSVVAELFDPLHRLAVDNVEPDAFWDARHQRIVAAFRAGRPLPKQDANYVGNAVRYAFPLTKQGLDSFLDCARRRRRIRELEAERLELYERSTS
jgi:hypothetical protein